MGEKRMGVLWMDGGGKENEEGKREKKGKRIRSWLDFWSLRVEEWHELHAEGRQ
jgi:hypothetical protein